MKRLVAEFPLTHDTRDRDGHIVAWARIAREAVAAYLAEIERHPGATVTLSLTSSA